MKGQIKHSTSSTPPIILVSFDDALFFPAYCYKSSETLVDSNVINNQKLHSGNTAPG